MTAAPDPNWFLSTTAQSTAALVAIVAGFVLSRVLALSSERSGLVVREAQLRHEIEIAEDAYHYLQRRLDGWDLTSFDEDALDVLLPDLASARFEEVLDREFDYGDLHEGELRDRFEELRATAQTAKAELRSLAHRQDRPTSFRDARRLLGLGPDTADLHVWERVWEEAFSGFKYLARARVAPTPAGASFYSDIARDRDRALDDRARAAAHLEVVRTELAKLSTPAGLGRLASALSLFLVTGVVVPVAVLAGQPTRLSSSLTWLIFAGFAIGLVLAIATVVTSVRDAFPHDKRP